MISGLGIDSVQVERIKKASKRWGKSFLKRLFTDRELDYCFKHKNPYPSLAARFAAKEAAMKALGTGFSRGVHWTGIEVVRHHGPPQLQFHGGALDRFTALGATRSLLTLTHSRELSIAHVLLMRD